MPRARNILGITVLSLLTVTAATLSAENWPQWRGPNLDGTTGETGLPTTWSETENVSWTLEVSEGTWTGSTPIVWEDTIFLSVSYLERSSTGRGGRFGRRGRGRGTGGRRRRTFGARPDGRRRREPDGRALAREPT